MAGIYVHIPFCKKKCTYCDFYFSTTFEKYRNDLVDSLCQEIKNRRDYLSDQNIETIYFGGGTPSLLTETEFSKILDTIHENFDTSSIKELTLEANPDDINPEKIFTWKRLGFNRLSIGLQTFDDKQLLWMNRAHNSQQAKDCVTIAQQSGITNISVDLIYGLPEMSNEEWKQQIQQAINLGVQHISAYCLTVEEKTTLHKMVSAHKISVASNQQQAEQFDILINTLEKNNFEHYEISNFAKKGFISNHNSNYWRGKEYLGIGPSAHSYNIKTRTYNVSNNQIYIHKTRENLETFETEFLTNKDVFNELLLIGLRCKWGVDLIRLNEFIPLDESFYQEIKKLIDTQKAVIKGDTLILTREGRFFADSIASDLFA